ncbi:MAG: DNA repair protein RecO [Nitrospirae bacterium]|jgi:DNA repair protein RecO (recombination protein O)|nr:DNA repair protein RecO [Nitrospirota bacterium]
MLHRTEGVVLRTFPFGEADLIVTYITPDLGILKLFAKSPRKIKSRFGSSLEPLTHSRIAFWGKENTPLPRLTQSDIIHSFQSVRNTLSRFLAVSEMLELTINFIPERDANKKSYFLLLNTLKAIEDNSLDNSSVIPLENENLFVSHFKIKFLKFAGFSPKLDACGRCGKNGNNFYISHGSILCETCARGIDYPIRISPAALKLYIDLLTWDISKIRRIKPSNMLLSELSNIINMHIKYILSKPLRCRDFFSFHVNDLTN